MKITQLLLSEKPSISCELFPPKERTQLVNAKKIVKEIALLKPSFISVTYGAGGSTAQHTIDIADEVQNTNGILALAHLTCVSANKNSIEDQLERLKEKNIVNILALRGDITRGEVFPLVNQYVHASDLMSKISAEYGFCIGGACYPQGHPESPSLKHDIDNLLRKMAAGCEFLTTQMFFENEVLYNFLEKAQKRGVDIPIVAGIMPVTNSKQIKRTCELSGMALPPKLMALVEKFGHDDDSMRDAGIAYATEQILDLLRQGVKNIHIYTMNKPDVAGKIFANLSHIHIKE